MFLEMFIIKEQKNKEDYFNESGHRFVLINHQYIAILKSECPPNTIRSYSNDNDEYYIYESHIQIGEFYLYHLPYSVKYVYQCHSTEVDTVTNNDITIDISSPIGYFGVKVQEEI